MVKTRRDSLSIHCNERVKKNKSKVFLNSVKSKSRELHGFFLHHLLCEVLEALTTTAKVCIIYTNTDVIIYNPVTVKKNYRRKIL